MGSVLLSFPDMIQDKQQMEDRLTLATDACLAIEADQH